MTQRRYLSILAIPILTISVVAPPLAPTVTEARVAVMPALSSPATSVAEHWTPVFVTEWGTSGTGAGQFNEPQGIAVDSAGYVYVADTENHRIQKFDSDGAFVFMWGWGVDNTGNLFQTCTSSCHAGAPGSQDGQFRRPRGVAVDASGNVFVTDTLNDRMQKFDTAGNYLTKWGSQGGGSASFYWPTAVAVDAAGYVYIGDRLNERVKKHSNGGTFSYLWGWGVRDGTAELQVCSTLTLPCQKGISGTGDGQMNDPTGVEIDISGNIFVADSENDRIQVFDDGGTYLTQWGTQGDGDGQLRTPADIAIDSRGIVYVVESGNRVSIFERDGKFLARWGTGGTGEAEFDYPRAIAVDSAGFIYVADTRNNRIQKFAGPWLDVFVGAPEMPRDH